jgi:hypothetical protein
MGAFSLEKFESASSVQENKLDDIFIILRIVLSMPGVAFGASSRLEMEQVSHSLGP